MSRQKESSVKPDCTILYFGEYADKTYLKKLENLSLKKGYPKVHLKEQPEFQEEQLSEFAKKC